MTLPVNFTNTNTADAILARWYIAVEGIQPRYGNFDPSWNPAPTGTNQHIYNYFTDLVSIRGQKIEPLNGKTTPHEFTVTIQDVGDALTSLFSVHAATIVSDFLNADMTAVATTIVVEDNTSFSVGDNIYVDRETMRVTVIDGGGTDMTVTRAMYGSKATAHNVNDYDGNPQSVEVSNAPRFFHTREVKLYESREGLAEADGIFLRGMLSNYNSNRDGTWSITAVGQLKRLAADIGWEAKKTHLVATLWGGTWSGVDAQFESNAQQMITDGVFVDLFDYSKRQLDLTHGAASFTTWCAMVHDHIDFESNGYIMIDNEIIKYVDTTTVDHSSIGTTDALVLDTDAQTEADDLPFNYIETTNGRGLLANEILGPQDGRVLMHPGLASLSDATVQSILPTRSILMAWHDVDATSRAAGPEVTQLFHIKDDPITIILKVLLSGGEGGTYDTLPAAWGLGLDEDMVDITGMVAMRDKLQLNGTKFELFLEKPINAKKFLEEHILRPALLYLTETWEGKISVGTLYSKEQAISEGYVLDITEDIWVGNGPTLNPGKPPIGELTIKCNYMPGEDKYLGVFRAVLGSAKTRYLSTARKFSIEVKSFYDYRIGSGTLTRTSNNTEGMQGLLMRYLATIWDRFSTYPMPIVSGTVPYNRMTDLVAGSIVRVTHSTLPNLALGSRGLVNEYFQVMEVTPNPKSSGLDLVLWQIGVHDNNTRRIAPSAEVFTYDATGNAKGGPRVQCRNNAYSDGSPVDVSYFNINDVIKFVTTDYIDIDVGETHAISAVGTTYIDLKTTPTTDPVATDILDTAPYDDSVADQQSNWCYLADANDVLGAANDAGHKRL